MIGIVIVSHSAALAQGVQEVVEQMVQGRVAVAAAGGTDNADAPIGTDPIKVLDAIEAVYSDDGVLVLMDLGSAIMSAEAAVELLAPEQQAHLYLCEAPLVEGAIAAAMAALTGGSMAQVFAEARGALVAKAEQLAPLLRVAPTAAAAPLPELATSSAPPDSLMASVVVPNRLGLHARPAARLVSLAGQFDARVTLTCHGRTVPATSMNQVATLGARYEDVLFFQASGAQAAAALDAIVALAADNFGDPFDDVAPIEAEAAAFPAGDGSERAGVAASGGVAIGPVALYRLTPPDVTEYLVADSAGEQQRLYAAIAVVIDGLRSLRAEVAQRVGPSEASIFDAHLLMLEDADLQQAASQIIALRQANAEAAWQQAIQAVAARYRALEDAYLARRADDVLDVGQRVLRQLTGDTGELSTLALAEPAIVVAHDLKPSDVVRLPAGLVLGIVTERGGANGHSAILARALSIPAVTGVGPVLAQLENGQVIALDGDAGCVWLAPDAALVDTLRQRQAANQAEQAAARQLAQRPAVTRDGRRIRVGANINGPADVKPALAHGAEGVGVFRTEYLFMDRTAPPSEEEQYAAYLEAALQLGDLPLIVRTLDAGGDKPLSYLPVGHEPNPFLGQRGLRYCLEHPGIFKPQLRAILRAAARHSIKLMLPMVSALDELLLANALLEECCAELQEEGQPFDDDLQVGIMIEVPSAVLAAEQLARFVDFFSIGTNDLAQYVMAADRGNAQVAGLVNALQPAVIHAIRQTVEAGHRTGIWVGLCGELAGDPRVTALLVGLGVDELSMNAPAIPHVKANIRALDGTHAAEVAQHVLGLLTVKEIEDYLDDMQHRGEE